MIHFDSILNFAAGLYDILQIFVQSQAEAPDTEIKEYTYWEYETCRQVQPSVVERTLVSLSRQDGVFIHKVQQCAVFTIRKFFYEMLHFLADSGNFIVMSAIGEYTIIIGST